MSLAVATTLLVPVERSVQDTSTSHENLHGKFSVASFVFAAFLISLEIGESPNSGESEERMAEISESLAALRVSLALATNRLVPVECSVQDTSTSHENLDGKFRKFRNFGAKNN